MWIFGKFVIALLQRVREAAVHIDGDLTGRIDHGLLVLVGVEHADAADRVPRLVERFLHYRVFNDEAGRMNRSVLDVGGGVLLVSQFTLAADTSKGRRPGFSTAAEPARAEPLFDALVAETRRQCRQVETGRFGADMQVSLVNDGPVTVWLQV